MLTALFFVSVLLCSDTSDPNKNKTRNIVSAYTLFYLFKEGCFFLLFFGHSFMYKKQLVDVFWRLTQKLPFWAHMVSKLKFRPLFLLQLLILPLQVVLVLLKSVGALDVSTFLNYLFCTFPKNLSKTAKTV